MAGQKRFEYIVIGGGTTGCVVAGRLAQAGASVALVEAGRHVTGEDLIDIPGNFGKTLGDPTLDWCYETVPQPGLGGRKVPLPRGKVLGGTSILNSMTWGRASKDEYDEIAKRLGNGTDWTWDDLLPNFMASETLIAPQSSEWASLHGATFEKSFHGTSGPLRRGFVPWLGESHVPFFRSLNRLGVPTNPDSCNGNNLGVFTLATAIDPVTSKRSSSTAAFYAPNADKITLIDGARVHKVVLNSSLVAVAVDYEGDGKRQRVSASKEIILCAGSYETPKILELSGIGDPKLLRKIGVRPIVDLPGVGENLQDHLLVPSSFEMKPGIITGDNLLDPDFARKEMEIYKQGGGGQYASIHSAFSVIPLRSAVTSSSAKKILDASLRDIPRFDPRLKAGQQALFDLQVKWYNDDRHGLLEFMHVPQFCALASSVPKPHTPYLSLLSLNMRPFARGTVHAHSNNPEDRPYIDPAYLSNEADLFLLAEALRFARRIALTEPLSDMIVAQSDPKPEVLEDDAALAEYIRANLETAHHPIGTASMMPRELGGVVGPDLRVYGCKGLRVADASILPIQLAAHPQATLYAIGEKASRLILAERALEVSATRARL